MKINRIIAAVLSVCIVGAVCPDFGNTVDFSIIANAKEEYTEGYLTFDIYYDDSVIISKCDENAKEIVIPSEINGLTVTYLFIPGYMRSAFTGCKNLTYIDIQCDVKITGQNTFADCENLTSINLPDSLTEICDGTFMNCKSLTKITIPESITSIGCLVGGFGRGAFLNCENLSEIILPSNLSHIGYNTFRNCKNLSAINIPTSVTSIYNGAFADCESLSEITILNPNCKITDYASTICNRYNEETETYEFDGTIYGYADSTAQAYAEKYGYNFVALDDESAEEIKYGDANLDGNVSISDAVAILQYLANSERFPLDGKAMKNADVDGKEGVTGMDAATIQLFDAGVLKELPIK